MKRVLFPLIVLCGLFLLLSGCGPAEDDIGDSPELTDLDVLTYGAPDKADLVDEKTDQIVPKAFDLMEYQSPVRNQGSRGVCSIFATVALMEHLYIKKGALSDPDFSEQYLQWSVKNEVGSFRNTSGSNSTDNLRAISDYGIVEEQAWPYESYQWSSANDPECTGGESMPTKCYTNGDPPQGALDAVKWKLPRSRWLSARASSIKAFMVNKNQGVIAGGTFFYQSWQHGRSTLPTRADYSRKGYVLAPNAKDREESLKSRAGHAFELVGWDDELEVQAIDEKGELMVDADGNPVSQKGFFLFKNSWGTGRFGLDNPKGVGYGWIQYDYVEDELSVVAADLPDVTPPVEVCGDGLDNDRDDQTDCDDSDCSAEPQCQGGPTSYENNDSVAIPDNEPAGVTSVIQVPDSFAVLALAVSVDISHSYSGDVEIRLIAPDGTDVQLLEPTMESTPDIRQTFVSSAFNGKTSAGSWTLKVIDHASMDTGTLNRWTIELTR